VLQYAFRAAQISLCCASALLVWNSVYPLARGVAQAGLEPLAPPPESRPVPELADYQIIDSRNLFKASDDGEAGPAVSEAPIELSRLQVQLVGTAVSGEAPELSVGIVRDLTQNKVRVVRIGQEVLESSTEKATVVKIEQRRILLDHDGRLEAVEVEDVAVAQAATRGALRDDGGASERVRARVERRMMNQLRRMNDPDGMAGAQSAVALERSQDGMVTGIQIQQLGAGSKLAEFGLQPGDRIVAVDGVQITDAVPLPQLMLSLGENTTKVFEIERNGAPTQVEIPADRVLELIQELGAVP
jgi:type II secretion system protein C